LVSHNPLRRIGAEAIASVPGEHCGSAADLAQAIVVPASAARSITDIYAGRINRTIPQARRLYQ
jgi:hypothetical protein